MSISRPQSAKKAVQISGAPAGAEVAQNRAQHVALQAGNAPHESAQETKKARINRACVPATAAGDSLVLAQSNFGQIPPRGVEPLLPD